MAGKARTGLQIRFNPDSERDLIEFFSRLKKAEVHITTVSAFRMYMRSTGFYEKMSLENAPFQTVAHKRKEPHSGNPGVRTGTESKGVFDQEAFETLDDMFENENELTNQSGSAALND